MDLTTLAMAKRYTNQQRLGYIEEETTPIFTDILVEGKGFTSVTGVQPNLIEGETYIVTINGVSEKYVCKYMPGDGYQQTYIGNFALYEHSKEDTGEDFLIAKVRETVVRIYNDRNEDISVSCVLYSETIHPIDPKYLPGACLPVVELSTIFQTYTGEQFAFTESESAALNKAASIGLPVVIKANMDGGSGTLMPVTYSAFNVGGVQLNGQLSIYVDGGVSSGFILLWEVGGEWLGQVVIEGM